MTSEDATVSWLDELANASARAAGVPEPAPATHPSEAAWQDAVRVGDITDVRTVAREITRGAHPGVPPEVGSKIDQLLTALMTMRAHYIVTTHLATERAPSHPAAQDSPEVSDGQALASVLRVAFGDYFTPERLERNRHTFDDVARLMRTRWANRTTCGTRGLAQAIARVMRLNWVTENGLYGSGGALYTFDRIGNDIAAGLEIREPDRYDQALAQLFGGVPSTGGCAGDPIECGYAAALGEAEEKLRQAEVALARKTDLSAVYGYELGENEAGRNVEAWLKTHRDRSAKDTSRWTVIDDLLDDYRLHNQTGTPLDQHVCDGGCLPGRETCPPDDDDEEEVPAP